MKWRSVALASTLLLAACSPGAVGPGERARTAAADSVEVRIPTGAGARQVAEILEDAGIVGHPLVFTAYIYLRGAAGELRAGAYRLPRRGGWGGLLSTLRAGAVLTRTLTVPPGSTLREIAPRLAAFTGTSPDSVLAVARAPAAARRLDVPGPTLEGYLFPETYRFAEGVPLATILETMIRRYRTFWGPEERARADSLGLTEREVVTLASIVEEEARVAEERPVIAGVYLNRLERAMLLQADPTVQFALDTPRARLLFRHIEQVADDPYNTYTQPGLPPGPIAAPGEASLRAVLHPAEHEFLYFVARPDGTHVFTRSQGEHAAAVARIRRGAEP